MKSSTDRPLDLDALSSLAPELASTIARVASDISLVIDRDGVITDVASGAAALSPSCGDWVGRRWVDTVTAETQAKIEALLGEARARGISRRREVSHPDPGGDIPVAWSAIQLGERGPVVAVGRDLRAVAAIQQRFIDTQNELERDYWQRREAEGRYRLLFQVARDAVLVLDATSREVVDANEAAVEVFGEALIGSKLPDRVRDGARAALLELLAAAQSSGRAGEIRLRHDGAAYDVSATPFRAEARHQLLLRVRRGASASEADTALSVAHAFVESTPDAVVITDSAGRVLHANRAFAALASARNESALRGRALAELMGDDDGAWRALIERVHHRGIAARAALGVRQSPGGVLPVEVTATLLTEGDQECLGFALRLSGALADGSTGAAARQLPLAEFVARIGLHSLDELLVDVQRHAERELIVAALERAGQVLPAAAALLGMTTYALMRRLRRHGLVIRTARRSDGEGIPSLN
jgi:transcriptional regulator PpsR